VVAGQLYILIKKVVNS